jgi:hypothetical protein
MDHPDFPSFPSAAEYPQPEKVHSDPGFALRYVLRRCKTVTSWLSLRAQGTVLSGGIVVRLSIVQLWRLEPPSLTRA